ncbi:MAG: hypothetical protein F6K56_18160 [Moorea sp. SIO3G5]|nr:hypothetical protein [Moorena sp. SIO3G5]
MPRFRQDQFIYGLAQLIEYFPEYAEILELLIEQIEQGKEAQITEMLLWLEEDD